MLNNINFWIFTILISSSLRAEEQSPRSRELWQESRDPMLKVMELENTRQDLPKSKWLSRDQKDLDQDINRILDEVVDMMQISGLTEAREAYRDLDARILKRRAEIRDLREATLSAEEDKSPLEFYKKTRADYEEELDALEVDVENLQDQQMAEIGKMMEAYENMGLDLSEQQVRFYLTSISGADMMNLSAVFENIRALNLQLEELVKQSPDDPEAARRYYGIHVTLIRTMLQAHVHVLERIDDLYLDRIKELEKGNDALMKETRGLIRFAEEQHQGLLESSYRTQKVTAQALDLYRDHLKSVRDQVYEAKKALDQRFQVAMNAYQTIQIAATLAEEMQSAVKDLSALREMHLPALIPLNDEALQQKFNEITRELEGE